MCLSVPHLGPTFSAVLKAGGTFLYFQSTWQVFTLRGYISAQDGHRLLLSTKVIVISSRIQFCSNLDCILNFHCD